MPFPTSTEIEQPPRREPVAQTPAGLGPRVEEFIVERLCTPLLDYIPASVHPNTISLLTHLTVWITTLLAVGSVRLEPPLRSAALVLASLGTVLCMIGDCLDGMHARNTDQCSKLGEMLDHWLDAMVVPLIPIGIATALELPAWGIAAVIPGAALVYHAQIVLYHHTRQFLHPDTATGASAQVGVALLYLVLAILVYFIERTHPVVNGSVVAIAIVGIYVQARCAFFYYARLGRQLREHATFVCMCALLSGLYLFHFIDLYAFVFSVVFLSFRITGAYVMGTVVNQRFHGNDAGVWVFLIGMWGTSLLCPSLSLGSIPVRAALPYVACLYMIGRNLADFWRHYGYLKPPLHSSAQS